MAITYLLFKIAAGIRNFQRRTKSNFYNSGNAPSCPWIC